MQIKAKLTACGIDIFVNNRKFSIKYPKTIWQKTPASVRQTLLENITFGETNYLPLILNKERIQYNINYPLFEPVFFKNQQADLLDCEQIDRAPHLSYFRKFYNLDYTFKSANSALINPSKMPRWSAKKPVAIIPFTFGKESLTTFALAKELGIEPVLVYSQEPVQPYEEKYKLKKLQELQKKYGVKTFFIQHEPGLFRYGRAFNKMLGTEIGWGAQTTLIALLVIPFVYAFKARYILIGNEFSNNETNSINGWKVYRSADQTSAMTAIQNNMVRLLTNNQCELKSSLEPLDEINIFYLLHHRYPALGKYQFSCSAEKPLYKNSSWCHQCYKCSRMFLFARCCDINPAAIGFKKDLFKEPNAFNHYFGKEIKSGSSEELDFAFYWLFKNNVRSPYTAKFKKNKLARLLPWQNYRQHFTSLKPAGNLPKKYEKKMLNIFNRELGSFKKLLPK